MNAPKRGRPRKWKSDAERMRAYRRRQRAAELRDEVAEATEELVDAQPIASLPTAETLTDLKELVNLLMIACRVEGGVEEWLHQTCDERFDRTLADLREESDAHEQTLAELRRHGQTVRAMTARLVEVDPDGPFVPKTLVQYRADVLAKWAKQSTHTSPSAWTRRPLIEPSECVGTELERASRLVEVISSDEVGLDARQPPTSIGLGGERVRCAYLSTKV